MRLPVTTEAEGVVLLPGGPAWSVVVTVALAQSTVLCKRLRNNRSETSRKILTCLPTLVRPRDSRCLWTGLVIQLILASRRIY